MMATAVVHYRGCHWSDRKCPGLPCRRHRSAYKPHDQGGRKEGVGDGRLASKRKDALLEFFEAVTWREMGIGMSTGLFVS